MAPPAPAVQPAGPQVARPARAARGPAAGLWGLEAKRSRGPGFFASLLIAVSAEGCGLVPTSQPSRDRRCGRRRGSTSLEAKVRGSARNPAGPWPQPPRLFDINRNSVGEHGLERRCRSQIWQRSHRARRNTAVLTFQSAGGRANRRVCGQEGQQDLRHRPDFLDELGAKMCPSWTDKTVCWRRTPNREICGGRLVAHLEFSRRGRVL